jgi:nifR3 family TIM-barrel protein
MFTEFISADGLIRDSIKSRQKLDIYEDERPIGIQIFGDKIDAMREAAAIAEEANPELLDINYGCPVKKVACKGAGAGILLDLPKMQAMTAEIVKNVKIPVTVKTRLGWDENNIRILEVVQRLQDVGIQAITIHARTRKQMYKGEADWSYLAEVKNNPSVRIPVFGNGDIDSPAKALEYKNRFGVDGIMVGRASIGYPWIFREIKYFMSHGELLPAPDLNERIEAVKKHLSFSVQWKGEKTGIFEMRRHYSNYFKGFTDFKNHRIALVEGNSIDELLQVLEEIQFKYSKEKELLH